MLIGGIAGAAEGWHYWNQANDLRPARANEIVNYGHVTVQYEQPSRHSIIGKAVQFVVDIPRGIENIAPSYNASDTTTMSPVDIKLGHAAALGFGGLALDVLGAVTWKKSVSK